MPRRISHDNSSIAVIKVLGGRERTLTKAFLRLKSCYLFEAHFCLVRRANEKGHVERLLGYARCNFLVPVPEVDSLITLNETLAERCRADLEHRTRGKSDISRENSWPKTRQPSYHDRSSHSRLGGSSRRRPIHSRKTVHAMTLCMTDSLIPELLSLNCLPAPPFGTGLPDLASVLPQPPPLRAEREA